MADGCNLYFTEKDIDQVEKSLGKGREIDEIKTASNILNGRIINNVDDFKNILENKDDPRNKIVQELLEKSLSNGKLTQDDEWKLSKALNTVLHFQKNIQGLFENPPKHRGPGADSMKHGGELLTTAALIQKGKIQTINGNTLYISKTDDTIAFGQKFPAKHTMSTHKRGTIEADTLIARDRGLLGGHDLIAIDTKYSKSSTTYGVKSSKDFNRQLEGIRNNFSDGNLQEFYFITNVKFSSGFKNGVNEYNIKIFKDRLEQDSEMRNNFNKYLTTQEKESSIPKKIENFDFSKNPSALIHAAKDYKVPQIELCEEVNYQK
jgi:hypothetical protein